MTDSPTRETRPDAAPPPSGPGPLRAQARGRVTRRGAATTETTETHREERTDG